MIIPNSYTYYYSQNISQCFVVDGHYKPSIRLHPQLSVSQVCSSWRDIALLTPQLWDNISIHDLAEATLSAAREYLSRAGDAPISMELDRHQSAPHYSDLSNFLSSYRLRSLWLCSNVQPLFLLSLPQRSVADLELLAVPWDSEEASLDLNDIRYPKLGVVHVWGTIKISGFNSSLRIFDGASLPMTVIESWDLLGRCPLLEESRFNLKRVNPSWRPVSMPQIHLQHLRILVLNAESYIPFSTFIEALSLPILEELRLDARVVAWPATAFQSLAHRSNCFPHLRGFYLKDSISNVDAGILLASMPWLKSISLYPCGNTIKVLFDQNDLGSGSPPRLTIVASS